MTKTKRKLYKIKKMRRQGLNYQERGEKIGEIKAGLFKTVEPQRAIEEPVQEIKEPVMEIKKKSWYLRLWGWILKIIRQKMKNIDEIKNLRVFDAFSGFGGFTIACERNGIETIGFSEIDKYANSVLKYHWPHIKNYGDITKIDIEALPDFDILTGGFPCQDLSIAKKNREGLEGSRSGLFYKLVKMLKIKKPKWFIFENVASMSKEAKQTITDTLWGIEPVMINASLVSAQNRKRLFWVGKLTDKGHIVLVENWEYEKVNIPQPQDRGILLKDILEDNPNIAPIKSKTIRTSGRGSGIDNKHNWDTIRIGQIGKGGQGDRIYSPNGKSVNLSANGGGRGAKTGLYAVALRNRGEGKKPEIGGNKANAMTTVQTDSMVMENTIIRKLTPKECARLMTIKDDWLDYGTNEKGEKVLISNSQRYKMAGNGVVVEVIDHIIKDLLKAI